jgi:hypothetical protein
MSFRTVPTSLRGKLWSLYREVRLDCTEPDSAPAVRRRLLMRFRDRLATIPGAEENLLASGLEADIRKMLKADPDEDPIDDPCSLLLWPERMRGMVETIDRGHVFVPARGEFVELSPTTITRVEVREAGEFLITKGKQSIQVGRNLKKLARAWVNPGVPDYVRYCRALIAGATTAKWLKERFDADEERRDKLLVPVDVRRELRAMMEKKVAELGGL